MSRLRDEASITRIRMLVGRAVIQRSACPISLENAGASHSRAIVVPEDMAACIHSPSCTNARDRAFLARESPNATLADAPKRRLHLSVERGSTKISLQCWATARPARSDAPRTPLAIDGLRTRMGSPTTRVAAWRGRHPCLPHQWPRRERARLEESRGQTVDSGFVARGFVVGFGRTLVPAHASRSLAVASTCWTSRIRVAAPAYTARTAGCADSRSARISSSGDNAAIEDSGIAGSPVAEIASSIATTSSHAEAIRSDSSAFGPGDGGALRGAVRNAAARWRNATASVRKRSRRYARGQRKGTGVTGSQLIGIRENAKHCEKCEAHCHETRRSARVNRVRRALPPCLPYA